MLILPGPGGPGGFAADAVLVATQHLGRPGPNGTDPRPRVVAHLGGDWSDLGAAVAHRPDAVLVPDCRGVADLDRLGARLDVAEAECGAADGATAVIASVADSAAGLAALLAAPSLSSRRLVALTWDAARLATDLGAAPDVLHAGPCGLAAALVPVAARAAGVAALAPDGSGENGSAAETCRMWRGLGYAGSLTRTAAEVAMVNSAFDPP